MEAGSVCNHEVLPSASLTYLVDLPYDPIVTVESFAEDKVFFLVQYLEEDLTKIWLPKTCQDIIQAVNVVELGNTVSQVTFQETHSHLKRI